MHRSRITKGRQNVAFALLAPLLLIGCATAAQRQYQAMATGNTAILAQAKNCTMEVYNSPDAAVVRVIRQLMREKRL